LRDKTARCSAGRRKPERRSAVLRRKSVNGWRGFGEHLGIAFQLVDDVLDYSGQQTGKTLLADLAEGKLTLTVVLAVAARLLSSPKSLQRIHDGDREPVEYVGEQVVQSGACDLVRERAREHTELAVQSLSAIPNSPAKGILVQVAHQLAARVA
jgi:octaprenyl-diphosphate synthase